MCLLVLILSYWSSFVVAFLAIKSNKYLHVSYTQLFDFLYIHDIKNITYLNIKKMKI